MSYFSAQQLKTYADTNNYVKQRIFHLAETAQDTRPMLPQFRDNMTYTERERVEANYWLELTAWEAAQQSRILSVSDCRKALRKVHAALVRRDQREVYDLGLGKWTRPWDVVPELANFQPPAGDYGVGIEIEMGFTSRESAGVAAKKLIKMKHVTLDWEGGTHPIEATFPPTLYSKFGSKSQAMRYSKFLKENSELLVQHSLENMVGTHVNVSVGNRDNHHYVAQRAECLGGYISRMTNEELVRYFGRRPYGYAYNQGKFIEYKLFNSTADHEVLRKYVEVAVSLTKLCESEEQLSHDAVVAACERGILLAEKKNSRARKVLAA